MKRKFGLSPLKASSVNDDPNWHIVQSHAGYPDLAFSRPPALDAQTEEELRTACAFILKDLKPSGHDLEDTRMKTDILVEEDEPGVPVPPIALPLRGNPHSAADWAGEKSTFRRAPAVSNSSSQRSKQHVRTPAVLQDVPAYLAKPEAQEPTPTAIVATPALARAVISPESTREPAPSVAPEVQQQPETSQRHSRNDDAAGAESRAMSSEDSSARSTTSTNQPFSNSTALTSAAFTPDVASQLGLGRKKEDRPSAADSPTVDRTHQRQISIDSSPLVDRTHRRQISTDSHTFDRTHRRQTSTASALERLKSMSSSTSLSSSTMGTPFEAQAVPIIHSRATSMLPPPLDEEDATTCEPLPKMFSPALTRWTEEADGEALKRAPSQSAMAQPKDQNVLDQTTPDFAQAMASPDPAMNEAGIPNALNFSSSRSVTSGHMAEQAPEVRPNGFTVNPKNPRRFRDQESPMIQPEPTDKELEAASEERMAAGSRAETSVRLRETPTTVRPIIPIRNLSDFDIRDKSEEPLATSKARIASRVNSRNLSTIMIERPDSMWLSEAKPQPLNPKPRSGENSSAVSPSVEAASRFAEPFLAVGDLGAPSRISQGTLDSLAAANPYGYNWPIPTHVPSPMPPLLEHETPSNTLTKVNTQDQDNSRPVSPPSVPQPQTTNLRLNTTPTGLHHRRQHAQTEISDLVAPLRPNTANSATNSTMLSPTLHSSTAAAAAATNHFLHRMPSPSIQNGNRTMSPPPTLSSPLALSPVTDSWATFPKQPLHQQQAPNQYRSPYTTNGNQSHTHLNRSNPNFHTPNLRSPTSPISGSMAPPPPRVINRNGSMVNTKNVLNGAMSPGAHLGQLPYHSTSQTGSRVDLSYPVISLTSLTNSTVRPTTPTAFGNSTSSYASSALPYAQGSPQLQQQHARARTNPTSGGSSGGFGKLMQRLGGDDGKKRREKENVKSKGWRAPKTAEELPYTYDDEEDEGACAAPVIRFGKGY